MHDTIDSVYAKLQELHTKSRAMDAINAVLEEEASEDKYLGELSKLFRGVTELSMLQSTLLTVPDASLILLKVKAPNVKIRRIFYCQFTSFFST